MSSTKTAAIIGGGVIGAGWAARFALNGWQVRVFDPDPQAQRKIDEVMGNARRSLPGLYDRALPTEQALQFCNSIEDTVAGADWVQESVPERLDIKHATFVQIAAAAPPQAVIASSTSGFTPSQLAEGVDMEPRLLVAHPFNPVYLLPLVELVPHPSTTVTEHARTLLTSVGMHPLVVRKEIDAHIADRFLEAVWREALWLVKDDIATTQEIDDAIRFGFGLRWAQMGLFETYRVAGGEAGMKHFIAQFGPCLQWPWTKLMDVPELTDELVQKIADQSDAQSGHYSIRELERLRDNHLVAMMRALRTQNWGAGATLLEHEHTLPSALGAGSPLLSVDRVVPLDWTDYNGHMNEARYLQAFGDATDFVMHHIGCTAQYIQDGHSFFTAETHIRHISEALAGQRIRIETQVLAGSAKKMHLFHSLHDEHGALIATGEHFLLHVSLESRRSCAALEPVAGRLAEIVAQHATLPSPEGAGRFVGQRS